VSQEPNTFWTDRFNNADNRLAYHGMAREIMAHLSNTIDEFIMCVGTGGRFSGTMAKTLWKYDNVLFESDVPVTCESSSAGIKYDCNARAQMTIGVSSRPKYVQLNGAIVKNFSYNSKTNTIT
jgi:hypothetical protein